MTSARIIGESFDATWAMSPDLAAMRLPGWMRYDGSLSWATGALIVAGERMAFAADAVAPDGWLRATIGWIPSADDMHEATLLDLDAARLEFVPVGGGGAGGRLVWTVDDVRIVVADPTYEYLATDCVLESEVFEFEASDVLEVEIEHTEIRRRITVSGGTLPAALVVTAGAVRALALPSEGYVLSTAAGAEGTAELTAFKPHLQTFSELAAERCNSRMGPQLRAFAAALVEPAALTYDALLGIRAALDVTQAVGAQLDLIGAVVGLAREGFDDDRYRVFLGIQIALLLSAQREDGGWTGTSENILLIARTFVGPVAPSIWLRNAPPYSYVLTIEDLAYAEAWLLVRFLGMATWAGVLGLLVVALADDSIWASDAVVVESFGSWDSATVVMEGMMAWGTAIPTT